MIRHRCSLDHFVLFFLRPHPTHSTTTDSGGGEGGGLMKPLAAVATSFVGMKLLFSHRRKKKGLQSLEEVSQSVS